MNHNKPKNTVWTKNRRLSILLGITIGIPFGLSTGCGYLYSHGHLEKLFQTSFTILATRFCFLLILGALLASTAIGIVYFVRKKLKLRDIPPEEIEDERAELIRQKAALKALQCFSFLFIVSPVFLFLDYKVSIYWLLLINIVLINLIFLGFMRYYSHKLG